MRTNSRLEPITEFRGRYRFLSNFYACQIELDGEVYPSVEHAYQASKTLDKLERMMIRTSATPGEAKRLGSPKGPLHIRPDWDEVKVDTMHNLLVKKFTSYPFNEMLLDTGDAHLEEGNQHGDNFWGTVDGKGQNYLGRLLMIIRGELQCA